MNLGVQIPLLVLAFNSFGYICGNSMFDFFEEPPYSFPLWLHHSITLLVKQYFSLDLLLVLIIPSLSRNPAGDIL